MSEYLRDQSPVDIINHVRPDHMSIEWFNGGDNRDVVVVDGLEAFRFPKDASGVTVGRYEFAALGLVYGKLSVEVPRPVKLADDGSYNVLGFLPGLVLSKHETAALPAQERTALGIGIAAFLHELNNVVAVSDLQSIAGERPLVRNRDDYYASIYHTAKEQSGTFADMYRTQYEHLLDLRPEGSSTDIIVFGDLSSPNLVLHDDHTLKGLIDWTELGVGDIHNELRPVYSVLGPEAYRALLPYIENKFGPINEELVRTLAVIHELSVLVGGKQKGTLTTDRTELAKRSLDQWLGEGWDLK